ncbi:MAG: 4-(cytidine 5'-diphospho)-2-C-methyl-D-erythritol kinase [Spirochaetales bacterium]|nr:4-(cytidine 5'-diphospho)-2-C-methyl-D-erythritol kinase [Spirochaetales bacterium]
MILEAPAKVNLHLEIKGMRADRYHEILSVVITVPLFDRVRIRSLKRNRILRVSCTPPVVREKNIAAAAVGSFRRASGIEAGIEVRVEKKIPLGAGLGGGSSDAAAVLGGLNRMFGNPLSTGRLRDLAAELGSDVPFFLGAAAAVMSGRGERIRPLRPRADIVLVLVYPGFAVSTTQAYRWFDGEGSRPPLKSMTVRQLEDRFERGKPDCWGFYNSFQPVIQARYPIIGRVAGQLTERGARFAVLSGSGSSVVGVFADSGEARGAARAMRKQYPGVWVLVPLQSGGSAD